jgi:hypothetical protein
MRHRLWTRLAGLRGHPGGPAPNDPRRQGPCTHQNRQLSSPRSVGGVVGFPGGFGRSRAGHGWRRRDRERSATPPFQFTRDRRSLARGRADTRRHEVAVTCITRHLVRVRRALSGSARHTCTARHGCGGSRAVRGYAGRRAGDRGDRRSRAPGDHQRSAANRMIGVGSLRVIDRLRLGAIHVCKIRRTNEESAPEPRD